MSALMVLVAVPKVLLLLLLAVVVDESSDGDRQKKRKMGRWRRQQSNAFGDENSDTHRERYRDRKTKR